MKRFSYFVLVVFAALVFSACNGSSDNTDGEDSGPSTTEQNPFNATQAEIDCGVYDDAISVDEYAECMNPEGDFEDPFNATQEELDCGLYDDSVSVDEYAECLEPDSSVDDVCGLYDDSVSVDEYAECLEQ
jgi:hypothetical protein